MDDQTKEAAKDAAKGAAAGAAAGAGFWMGIPLVANLVGFTTSGIAAGSQAAAWMSAAAAANGGGVAAGSFVATMQSIGVAGLAATTGLFLVTGGAVVVGGATMYYKVYGGPNANKLSPSKCWVVITSSSDNPEKTELEQPEIVLFDSEEVARKSYDESEASSKALFAPRKELVLTEGWQERFRSIVAAL